MKKILVLFCILLIACQTSIEPEMLPKIEPSVEPSEPNYFTPGTSWHWQLQEDLKEYNVDVYDIDLFDTSPKTIQELHDKGIKVICYFSAGTYEDWRPDSELFPQRALGKPLEDWEGETWLDITNNKVKEIMENRLDLARTKNCDAVEPDNIDSYTQDTGFPITYQDQLNYNIWLSEQAHKRNLKIALKNNPEQVTDLLNHFDFAIVEECFEYNECNQYLPFINQGKAVFAAEYNLELEEFCEKAKNLKFSALKLDPELNGSRIICN
ncbi:endo alpha-1,4 polygalactosaminidase [Candidatus Woesearchaeota archaeon]|nr:endo alpha-1,4 polygalactosaminidase [Candidatus Woesearchaeota archaeon]